MKALVCGFKNESHPLAADNKCSVDGIASPDNVAAIPEHGQLIIGEDTSSHQNDMVWVRDNADGKLTRVATTPYGSETTSPYWYT
jgi:secreted PhoX family phosphatase